MIDPITAAYMAASTLALTLCVGVLIWAGIERRRARKVYRWSRVPRGNGRRKDRY